MFKNKKQKTKNKKHLIFLLFNSIFFKNQGCVFHDENFECIDRSSIYSATDNAMAIFIFLIGSMQDPLRSRHANLATGA